MSSAMKDRLAGAQSGAGDSVKAKKNKGPLTDIPVLVQADESTGEVAEPSVKELMAAGRASNSPTALAIAVEVLESDSDPSIAAEVRESETAEPMQKSSGGVVPKIGVTSKSETAEPMQQNIEATLVSELCAPPAPMGSLLEESRLMSVPLTEEAYLLLQKLDRDAALATGRAVNRARLITKSLEAVLVDPDRYAGEYLKAQQDGTTWKRRTQGRIPASLADKLPALRYTGIHRQSAGMMVSVCVSENLQQMAKELAASSNVAM